MNRHPLRAPFEPSPCHTSKQGVQGHSARPRRPSGLGVRKGALAALLLLSVPVLVSVPALASAQELPEADELIQSYVEAIGGEEAHGTPTSIRTAGTMSLPGMGIEGEFELLQIPDVGSRMVSTIPGMGELMVGFDGQVGWSLNPMTGAQLMEAEELAQMRERTQLAATLRDPELVTERETIEEIQVQGEACYRVRLVWASGRETFDCYATDSGLLLQSEDVQVSDMGEVPTTTRYADYAEFHGMVLPTRMIQETMGMEQVLEIREVSIDDADAAELDPPPEIRTLLEGD